MKKFKGLMAAPFTPMLSTGEINLDLIPDYAAWLRENGVRGIFVNGTTGEGLSLTMDERKKLVESWRQHAGELKLMVHVARQSWPEAGCLAAHARAAGADAISLSAPCFFKPQQAELIEFCGAVANHAPDLPFYYYHIPSLTGVNLRMSDFLAAASPEIPSLAGVKYTHYDIMDYQRSIELANCRFDLLFGRDEILLAGLAVGATGAIGSTYNYAAPLYQKLISAFQDHDLPLARKLQSRSQQLVAILEQSNNGIACGKAIMSILSGLDCGPCRRPLPAFSTRQQQWLQKQLQPWRDLA